MFIYITYLQPSNYLHVKHSVQTTSHWPAQGIALWNILKHVQKWPKTRLFDHLESRSLVLPYFCVINVNNKNAQLFFYKCSFVYFLHCMHYFHLHHHHHHKRCITEMLLSLRYLCVNKILQTESKLDPTNQKLRTGTASLMFSQSSYL